MKILVTGGAGFIGSAVVRQLINQTGHSVCIADKLTYAGNLDSLKLIMSNERCLFEKIDICDAQALAAVFNNFQPDIIMHLAAESHVDRSIGSASEFIQTNIIGTFQLLERSRLYWSDLPPTKKNTFKFHHISTDEVFGDLESSGALFTEESNYQPSSPYAASKASSDHLVKAWHRTYGLPVVITNCSNNYGPFHFPEKLIPLVILNALEGKPLPVYGDGKQIRDWLYVEDHARALVKVAEEGLNGETYNIGGHNEIANIDVVHLICSLLEELRPNKPKGILNYSDLITFVPDRPGHDLRYAIDATKISKELHWSPVETFETGLRRTVIWFLENPVWWGRILDGSYKRERLGI